MTTFSEMLKTVTRSARVCRGESLGTRTMQSVWKLHRPVNKKELEAEASGDSKHEIKLESLILAQSERLRRA